MSDRTLEQRLAGAAAALETPAIDFVAAARAEGLQDVAYAVEPSPLGDLLVAVTPRGLVKISYTDLYPTEAALEQIAARISPRVLEDPGALDEPRRQLDEYFSGRRREFELPLDWSLIRGFTREVLDRTARIPYGQVATYGEVARDIGKPRASRAAGNALGANPIPIVVPCHRVIGASGQLTGYTGGLHRKIALLEIEGVALPR
jgi:methylated-DNA-[protein]-cysteine S-methyltransferase